jgi:hypothetical protein
MARNLFKVQLSNTQHLIHLILLEQQQQSEQQDQLEQAQEQEQEQQQQILSQAATKRQLLHVQSALNKALWHTKDPKS